MEFNENYKQRPQYDNWVSKKFIYYSLVISIITGALLIYLKSAVNLSFNWIIQGVVFIVFIFSVTFFIWVIIARKAFDYNNKNGIALKLIKMITEHVNVKSDSTILDIGCGSGALTISIAKANTGAKVVGLDYWGRDFEQYSKSLCEANAAAEKVNNITFVNGNAVSLDFEDESFDAIVSNYVYHNIFGHNKQELLLESLRVLKKGGVFAIHDLMSYRRFGDMETFVNKLKSMGYSEVHLKRTDCSPIINKTKAHSLGLSGSTLLYGVK